MPGLHSITDPGRTRGGLVVVPSALDPDTLGDIVRASLFSDARAEASDRVPDGSEDRRGWWADAYDSRPLGSRLWLTLDRARVTADTASACEVAARDALAWLVADGIASSVTVRAERSGRDRIGLDVTIRRVDGSAARLQYPDLWRAAGA